MTAGLPPAGLMGEPDAGGRFGDFGGRFVPEALVPACQDLEQAFRAPGRDAVQGALRRPPA